MKSILSSKTMYRLPIRKKSQPLKLLQLTKRRLQKR
jgi:hypothetical protein